MHQPVDRCFGLLVFVLSAGCLLGIDSSSLPDVVSQVKQMVAGGKPRGEIAEFVTKIVDDRIVSLNRATADERNSLNQTRYDIIKQTFDAWSEEGVDVDEPYAAAAWAWQNRGGHCQENAHTAYHILMLATESGDEIGEFACGDHVYMIWGVPKGFTGEVTIDAINSWKDAYVIDPWLGQCKPAGEVGRLDLALTKAGLYAINRVATWSYSNYRKKYDLWLKSCDNFAGSYGVASDRLVVTEVNGKSNVSVGQTMNMKPAGSFQVAQNSTDVRITFRASELTGSAVGRIAWLGNVVKGNINSAALTKFKLGGKDRLKVALRTDNPQTGTVIIREGILTKIQ